jgi:hypothetical protein
LKTVYKYPISVNDCVTITMPKGAEILKVAEQYGVLNVWALVDNSKPLVSHAFAWRGTGHDCTDLNKHMFIDSVLMHGGQLVFHLFDLGD